MKKSLKLIVVGLVALFMFGGCGDSVPTEEDAKKALKDMNLGFEILSFDKIDGKKGEMNGIETYVMYFKAKVIYPKGLRADCLKKPSSIYNEDLSFNDCVNVNKIKDIGDKEFIEGSIPFEKRESGWFGHIDDYGFGRYAGIEFRTIRQ